MTLVELFEAAHRARAQGHGYIQVQVRRRARPRNWDRVRVIGPIYGKCIGECDEGGVFLVDVPLGQFGSGPSEGEERKEGT